MNTVLIVLFILVILSFITGVCLTIYEKKHVESSNIPMNNIVINNDLIETLDFDDTSVIDLYDAEII